MTQHIKNLPTSLFKFAIQYAIVTNKNGNIMYLGNLFLKIESNLIIVLISMKLNLIPGKLRRSFTRNYFKITFSCA